MIRECKLQMNLFHILYRGRERVCKEELVKHPQIKTEYNDLL